MPAPLHSAPGQLPGHDDQADAADLDDLAGELNALGCTALLLTPPGQPPRVDVSLPGDMTPGEQVRAHAGTFFWRDTQPIGPSDQPAAAAATITRALLHPAATPAR